MVVGRWLLVAVLMAVGASAWGAESVDVEGLLKGFDEACGKDFERVSHEVVKSKEDEWLLIGVKARKAGLWVIRHECRTTLPSLPRREHLTREYHLWIGEAGKARRHEFDPISPRTYPLACVKDTVLVPIHILPSLVEHRFSRESASPARLEATRRWNEEIAAGKFTGMMGQKLDVTDNAGGNLHVGQKWGSADLSVDGSFAIHELCGRLWARKPGRFTLVGLVKDMPEAGRSYPVVVVAAKEPVTVLAVEAHVVQRSADEIERRRALVFSTEHFPLRTLVLREGDEVRLKLGEFKTTEDPENRAETWTYPAVELKAEEFRAAEGQFGFTGVPAAAATRPATLPAGTTKDR